MISLWDSHNFDTNSTEGSKTWFSVTFGLRQVSKMIWNVHQTPVWKIWEEFETFLENKQISKMRKKHLGDQIVINSYVYMFLTVTNLELNPISYAISRDHFQLF